jgi:probable phosphoglycerate mutase
VAARLGEEVRPCEALAEVDFGDWAGRRVDDLRAGDPRWRWWNEFRSGTPAPGGETAVEVQARVVGEVLRLRSVHPETVVALVSHADVIRAALAWALGVPLDLARRLEVGLASASVVAIGDGGPWVLGVNLVEGVPLPG